MAEEWDGADEDMLFDGGEAAEVVTGILDSAPATALSSRAEQKKSVL